ncbi:MAG: acyl-CoA dehydrogenase family protein [Thermoplasmata archaeon]|nr:acyl-CoA dehydrogenase family protein [Thermoplasmata archaeon]
MEVDSRRGADAWRSRARSFAEREIDPIVGAIDREDRLPPSVRSGLAEAGFFGVGLPKEFGGSGDDTRATVAVLEELSHASAAVATMVAVHLSVAAQPIARWGSDRLKEKHLRGLSSGRLLGAFALTEPGGGSDAAGLQCRYAHEGGGYRLEGSKTFITNAGLADLVLVFATRDPALGHRGISAFVLPKGTTGFRVQPTFQKLGLRGSETVEFSLTDVRLPEEAMLGPEGDGLKVALSALAGGRVGIAACAVGVARAAFEQMQRAARKDPSDWKRAIVARSFTELSASQALLESAVRAKDSGGEFVTEASAAKLFASRAAVGIASAGMDVAGRESARSGSAAERLLRDARVFPIVEGTTEIQELILGRSLLEG